MRTSLRRAGRSLPLRQQEQQQQQQQYRLQSVDCRRCVASTPSVQRSESAAPEGSIVALHGKSSNTERISEQLNPLTNFAELVCVPGVEADASADSALRWSERKLRPGVELPPGLNEVQARNLADTWMYDEDSLERSITLVVTAVKERKRLLRGAPVGLAGHSQGANVAAMVSSRMRIANERHLAPAFLLLFCPVESGWASANQKSAFTQTQLFSFNQSGMPDRPTLIVIGEQDQQKPSCERFSALLGLGENAPDLTEVKSPSGFPITLCRHSEGHKPFPLNEAEREKVVNCVQSTVDASRR